MPRTIPAQGAAAQPVAKSKEDRYLIGQLQLQAALTAKDNAAIASAIDAWLAIDHARFHPRSPISTEALARPFYVPSNFDPAAAAFEQSGRCRSANSGRVLDCCRNAQRAGPQGRSRATLPARHPGDARGRPESPRKCLSSARWRWLMTASWRRRSNSAGNGSRPIQAPTAGATRSLIYRNMTQPDVEGRSPCCG